MLKRVRIHIISDRYTVQGSLFEDGPSPADIKQSEPASERERMEMTVEGALRDDGVRVSLTYRESELTGMQGASTSISFCHSDPGLISMLRDGSVKTALVFQAQRRHLCAYHTEIMPFEVGVYTRKVNNRLLTDGKLELWYLVELRGAEAEFNHFTLSLLPYCNKPQNKEPLS